MGRRWGLIDLWLGIHRVQLEGENAEQKMIGYLRFIPCSSFGVR